VCVLHLFNDQWRPLLTSAYFWYLTVLAVGGIVAVAFYDPLKPSTGFLVLIPLLQVREFTVPYVFHLWEYVCKLFVIIKAYKVYVSI